MIYRNKEFLILNKISLQESAEQKQTRDNKTIQSLRSENKRLQQHVEETKTR